MHGDIIFHFGNIIWKLPLSKKCKPFDWSCFYDKQLATDVLTKKRLASPSRCTLYYNHEDNVEHLFFNHNFFNIVWNSFQGGCNIKAFPKNINNLWSDWSSRRLTKFRKASNILATITCWTLWMERDNITFHSEAHPNKEIARTILVLAVDWTKTSDKKYFKR